MDTGRPPRLAIGLTGGIGSGKSTVADLFAQAGASIIDTDLIAHAQTAPGGPAMPAIAAEFGNEFVRPDGALDRARMRALVFADPPARARLEAILHPRIRATVDAEAALAAGPYVIHVVPLLVESGGWRERVHRVLVVDCPEAVQIARVMARNAMDESQVKAIMAAQASRKERLAAADDVVDNADGLEALEPQVGRLHASYLAIATGGVGTVPLRPGMRRL
jgi:dephospho-CoA kinase